MRKMIGVIKRTRESEISSYVEKGKSSGNILEKSSRSKLQKLEQYKTLASIIVHN